MHRTTLGTLAHLSLYRSFAGPALAYRLAFAGRTAA